MDQAELKRRTDEVMTPEFTKLAEDTLRTKGPRALDALADKEIEKYRAMWAAAEPPQVTPEGLALRSAIQADLSQRLRTGNTTPVPLDQTAEEWRRDPALRKEFLDSYDCYAAYKRAVADGRARISTGGKIIR